jgi:seryl-tRNA synthetase
VALASPEGQEFYAALVSHRLLIPVGAQGMFGRGAVFEDVLRRVDAMISRVAAEDGAELMAFPPIIEREVLEKSGYLRSFPQLVGAVHGFAGGSREHAALMERLETKKPYDDLLSQTEIVLNPAACYPVYPTFRGTLPASGAKVDMQNWVFRREPSPEPTRMQAFRVREFVRIGHPDVVTAWRDMWLERGLVLLTSLGLAARADVASDPFFGRTGKLLAANQRDEKLKLEILVPVLSEASPTAVCSFNYHQNHFGSLFDIKTADGECAHSGCLGFGMERVVMALFRTHGFVPARWPIEVRERLLA